MGIRLNKYLSLCGLGSRRKCDQYIEEGEISINGKVVQDFSYRVQECDTVKYKNRVVEPEETTYVIFNKPQGVITTLDDPQNRKNVGDYFKKLPYIKPVGRLDKDTTGVLLLTNDGDLLYKLTHPKYQIPKKYVVTLDSQVSGKIKNKIAQGVILENGEIARGQIIRVKSKAHSIVTMILREGKKREIRRMFAAIGYGVLELDRVSFATLTYHGLQRGEWRYLKEKEINLLKKMTKDK